MRGRRVGESLMMRVSQTVMMHRVCVFVCVSGRVVPLCVRLCVPGGCDVILCFPSVLFCSLLSTCWSRAPSRGGVEQPTHFHSQRHITSHTHTCTHTGLDYLPPLANAHLSPFSDLQTVLEGPKYCF